MWRCKVLTVAIGLLTLALTTPNSGAITVSPSGTTIPSATSITDYTCAVWTLSGGSVYRNGAKAGANTGITEVLYLGGTIYEENSTGSWWGWYPSGWTAVGNPLVPQSIAAFVNSIGINTDMSYVGSPYYGNATQVETALTYLGINTIRDAPPGYFNDPTTTTADNALAAAGVKFEVLLLGNGEVNVTGNVASIAAFQQAFPGVITGIEGPNEINGFPITYKGQTNSELAGIAVTKALWGAVGGNATLAGIPVYALTLSNGIVGVQAQVASLGNLAQYVNYGNAHIYASQSDNVWTFDMPFWLPLFEEPTPRVPMIITETGYATLSGNVDQAAEAKYGLNTLFENAMNGIARTFIFDLIDMNSSDVSTPADHTGQFLTNFTAKASGTAIHNMTTILAGAGGGTASSTLAYTAVGLPPGTGHSYELGSSTVYDIAVWVDYTIYNPTSNTDITAPSNPVTITFPTTHTSISVFDPMVGTTAIATYSGVNSVPLTVVDHPLIVQVTP